jgi:hypothetical protein
MKRAGLIALLILSAGVLYPSHASAEGVLRLGGGVFLDGDLPGVTGSIDIPIGGSGAAFSPFTDVYFKGGDRVAAFGANLMFRRHTGEKSWMYLGVGGGFGNVKSEKHESDYLPELDIERILVAKKTVPMANIVLGLEYASTERTSMFVQGRWIGMLSGSDTRVLLSDGTERAAQLDAKHVAVTVGLAVRFGSSEKDIDY